MPQTIWYFRKRLIALKVLISQDSIGLTEAQELVDKISDKSPDKRLRKTGQGVPMTKTGNKEIIEIEREETFLLNP